MTERARVFCKNCKWYDYEFDCYYEYYRHECLFGLGEPVTEYHPIWGAHDAYKGDIIDPQWKNANMNCPDYEPKETDDADTKD